MKSLTEALVALAGAMIFVWIRHKEHKQSVRLLISGASGMTGYSLAPDVAGVVGWMGEPSAMFLICVSAYAVIDTALAIIADKGAILDIVKARVGRK